MSYSDAGAYVERAMAPHRGHVHDIAAALCAYQRITAAAADAVSTRLRAKCRSCGAVKCMSWRIESPKLHQHKRECNESAHALAF